MSKKNKLILWVLACVLFGIFFLFVPEMMDSISGAALSGKTLSEEDAKNIVGFELVTNPANPSSINSSKATGIGSAVIASSPVAAGEWMAKNLRFKQEGDVTVVQVDLSPVGAVNAWPALRVETTSSDGHVMRSFQVLSTEYEHPVNTTSASSMIAFRMRVRVGERGIHVQVSG